MTEETPGTSTMTLDEQMENQMWLMMLHQFKNDPDECKRIHSNHGRTWLHRLCARGSTPAFLLEQVASLYPEAMEIQDTYFGDTPIHMVCRNSQFSAKKLKAMLALCPDVENAVLIRNRLGATALHSACNHNAVIEAMVALVNANPKILKVVSLDGTHAVTALFTAYTQTIPGHMNVVRILKDELVESEAFERFWDRVQFLAGFYFAVVKETCPLHLKVTSTQIEQNRKIDLEATKQLYPYLLHGLMNCNVPFNMFRLALKRVPSCADVADADGNFPLHLLVQNRPYRLKESDAIVASLNAAPHVTSKANRNGEIPLMIAIRNKIPWEHGLGEIAKANISVVDRKDPVTGFYPFQEAALQGGKVAVETTYHLLCTRPDLLHS